MPPSIREVGLLAHWERRSVYGGKCARKRESSGAGGYFERVAVERCGEETSLFTREEEEVLCYSFQK